jgi:hypothetical protein
MVTPTATREELIRALAELARRTEQYRWLLFEICPWPFYWPTYCEAVPQSLEERLQIELDRQPRRKPPLVLTPEQGVLEF